MRSTNRRVAVSLLLTCFWCVFTADGQSQSREDGNGAVPAQYDIEPPGIDPALFFGTANADSAQYRLGPEDVLEISVFDMEQFNRTVRVSGAGTIDLPLVGLIDVQGLIPERAAARVAERLRDDFVPWCTTRDLGPQLSFTHGFEVPHEHFQTHSAEVCEEGLSREELA